MQHQRRPGLIARDRELGGDARRLGIQLKVEMNGLDAESGRFIISEMNGAGFFGAHANLNRDGARLAGKRHVCQGAWARRRRAARTAVAGCEPSQLGAHPFLPQLLSSIRLRNSPS